jgi:septal ring factor EnvC (AmiA/AmiB activator)
VVVQQITSLCAKNLERSLKSVIPSHVKQIVALNLKATRFGEIYRQIEEKEAIKCEQQTKFDRLDKKVDTYRRKSTERNKLLTEALKEYIEDIDELDREIAHLNTAEARS